MNNSISESKNLFGRTPLTGEMGGEDLKKSGSIGKMCLCKQKHPNRWTRQSYFARTRRVVQEGKWDRATSQFMIANESAIDVRSANGLLAPNEEQCSKGCASQWS